MPGFEGFKVHKHWWTPLVLIATVIVGMGLLKHTHLFQLAAVIGLGVWYLRHHHRKQIEMAKAKAEAQSLHLSDEHLEKLADLVVQRLHTRPGPKGHEHSLN